jgi:molybdate transport system regulatory protein
MSRLTIRLDLDSGSSIGPGKVGLLEAVDEQGSTRKAAIRMGMSFRQAWLLLQELEETFGAAVTETVRGGAGGGGTRLTELGRWVIAHYRHIERVAERAAQADLDAFETKTVRMGAMQKTAHRRKLLKKK